MLLFLTSAAHKAVADWMAAECARRDTPFLCLYTEQFPQDITVVALPVAGHLAGKVRYGDRSCQWDSITGVWCYLPGVTTLDPELDSVSAQLIQQESREALYGIYRALDDRRWINSPHAEHAANYRAYQLRLASQVGFQIPATIITNHPDDAIAFLRRCNGQMVYKPISSFVLHDVEGNPTDITYVTLITDENLLEHAESIRISPCMFQELIMKRCDVTVYVIGETVWATAIDSQQQAIVNDVDYRRNGLWKSRHTPLLLPLRMEQMCREMTTRMGLRMCNFDFALTPDGTYVFLDANPTDLWAAIEALVGFPLCTAVVDALLGINTLVNHPYLKDRSLHFQPSVNAQRV